mmetsp:Transcript_113789/g.368183  ORF Transcript_113789/g.368183 Transcript_113789/m.368183 type:complete len:424 (-) Transcript_113789:335-1606(-)
MDNEGGTSGAEEPGIGSLPSVRLPLVSDTQGSQLEASSSSVAGGAPVADELDEEDLFGSGVEDEAPPPPAPRAAPAGAATDGSRGIAGAVPNEQALFGGSADDLDERALFGGDSDDSGDLDERALFGSEDEGGQEIDERALFGSDEEEAAPAAPAEAAPRSPAPSELSEMDEHEIFGDVSDDEPEKMEDVILRRRPAPSDDRVFLNMRLPNVLSIERTAYHADSIPQTLLEGYKEFKNTQNKRSTRLLNPENCVRWRFKKGPDGHGLTDEDGRPQYESNSRIVEWEDGSRTLYVGNESYELTEIEDHILIFEENSQDVHVCHGSLRKRLVATPRDLQSATHEMLKRSQYNKFEANRRSLLMSQEEQDAHQQLLEIQADQKQKQRREEQQKQALEEGAGGMTRAFLEDDAADESSRQLKRAKSG